MDYKLIINQILWLFYLLPIQYMLKCNIRKKKIMYFLYYLVILLLWIQYINVTFKLELAYKWNWLIHIINFITGPLHMFLLGIHIGIIIIILNTTINVKKSINSSITIKKYFKPMLADIQNMIYNSVAILFTIGLLIFSNYLKIPLVK